MKKHLSLSSQARTALKDPNKLSIQCILDEEQPENSKCAHAYTALCLAIAGNHGAQIPEATIQDHLNQLKGKLGKSKKTISHILEDGARSIPACNPATRRIKNELEHRSNQHMTAVVAETVLDAIVPTGTRNRPITDFNNGWKQLLVAISLVLGFKFIFKN